MNRARHSWRSSVTSGTTARRLSLRGAATAVVASALLAPLVGVSTANAAAYDPATDPYSMAAVTASMGARAWWTSGFTGQGVDVALIDTGVSPVPGLDGANKLIHGPDLSLESQAPNLARFDTNGHGTFMAGLIAGKDSSLTPSSTALPAASAYRGVAPDARVVSLKVATADGGVDVSQVIAAVNWVVDHKNDNGMNIRVLNLSYGTNSSQSATLDPLSYAVERAWKAGIVVVAAAGNAGYVKGGNSPCMANPAFNPYVIAVGGVDTMGTPVSSDDKVGAYSSAGAAGCKSPDFVAPGSHIQGLRVANSYLDAAHPEGLLGTRYFRGSGTSQAAALTSGAVALVLQKFPNLTPDQVKKFFATYGDALSATIGFQQGAGEIRLVAMLPKTPANYTQKLTNATGGGTLEAARGTDHLSRDGIALSGEKDIFGKPFNAGTPGSSWSGGTWNGSTWSGSTWSGSTWSGSTWSGSTWSGSTWSGSTWSGASWSGSTWSGGSWAGGSWT